MGGWTGVWVGGLVGGRWEAEWVGGREGGNPVADGIEKSTQ